MRFTIGDRVKVIDQEITGVVVRHDTGSKLIILDDDYAEYADNADEGELVFNASDLEEDIYDHWGKTKAEMREEAISMLERLLELEHNKHSYPQDGSNGQAKAYHYALVESLKGDVK
jgi:hypothetical protein